MRLLHTADWHLGRTFHGADLSASQARVLDRLIEVAASERPDALIVAGDVFDRAYPPLEAVELYDETLKRLADLRVPVVVTSGNHDSAIRLGVNGRLAESAGVHLRTRLDRIGEPIHLQSADSVDGLLVYAVPYLDPPSTAVTLAADEPTHAGVIGAALARIRSDRASRPGVPAVVVAHGVVTGGRSTTFNEVATTGAERSIDVGGVSAVPARLFAGFDYVALGHLHRPQNVGDRARYSGAPIAFGFDEAGDHKSWSLVDLRGEVAPEVTEIETPVARAIARVRGSLDELLTDASLAEHEGSWVEATVTDRLRPRHGMDRLRRRFPHVLKLDHRPEGAAIDGDGVAQDYRARVRGRSESEIVERFLADVRGGIDADDDERALVTEALEAFEREEALR
ncbi:MAG: exonuclease SbcCD subunit D [Patulibacter sp.]|nr:exonuclease SbcCD subunit D [Patulibacter sp.]